jgi:hypothetical protein
VLHASELAGDDSLEYAKTLNSYGNCLCLFKPAGKQGVAFNALVNKKIEKALATLEEALKIRRIVYRDQHPLIAETLSNLGLALVIKAASASKLGYFKARVRVPGENTDEFNEMLTGRAPEDNRSDVGSNGNSVVLVGGGSVLEGDETSPAGSMVPASQAASATNTQPNTANNSAVLSSAPEEAISANEAFFEVQYDEDDLPVFPEAIFRLAQSKLLDALEILYGNYPEQQNNNNTSTRHIVFVNIEGNIGQCIW